MLQRLVEVYNLNMQPFLEHIFNEITQMYVKYHDNDEYFQ